MADRLGIRGRSIELYVRFFDPSGNPVNADAAPSVEITDTDGVVRRLLTTTGVSQEGDSEGLYRFDYEIPLSGPDGYWSDKWVAIIGGETVESTFQFLVQEDGSVEQDIAPVFQPTGSSTFTFSKCEAEGIDKLMAILKKSMEGLLKGMKS